MKYYIFLCAIIFNLIAQTSIAQKNKLKNIVAPKFQGGDSALLNYIYENRKSDEILNQGYEGIIKVNYTIDTFGKAIKPRIELGLCKECDSNAIELVKNMPLWTPATSKGIKVEYEEKIELYYLTKWNKDYYYNRGLIYYKNQNYIMAANCFKLAVMEDSTDYDAFFNLAVIAKKMKDNLLFCKCLDKAKRNGDTSISTLFNKSCLSIDSLTNFQSSLIKGVFKFDSFPYILYSDGSKVWVDNIILNYVWDYMKDHYKSYSKYYGSTDKDIRISVHYIIDANGKISNLYIWSKSKELNKIIDHKLVDFLNNIKGIYPASYNGDPVPFAYGFNFILKKPE